MMDNIDRHKQLIDDLHNTYKQKNEAYGDSFSISYEKYGIISALTRISDKFNRFENLVLAQQKNKQIDVGDERIRDTLLDMANYCLMTILELDNFSEKDA